MFKKLLFTFCFFLCATVAVLAQPVTVSGVIASGRFSTCTFGPPVVTITRNAALSGPGSNVSGGQLVCTDPCDSTVLTVSLTNVRWNQTPGVNWVHGIFFPTNAGFTVSSNTLPAGWRFFSTCTGASCSAGITGGQGFYFDGTTGNSCCPTNTLGDGIPWNNYGDITANCPVDYAFNFNIKVCNSILTTTSQTFKLRGTADGGTGCWGTADNSSHNIQWTIATVACTPLYSPAPTTNSIQKVCLPTPGYIAEITGGCGNGNTISWWTASTGGTQVGTGSPFYYFSPSCPVGTTLYAQCCPVGTTCATRRAFAISGVCPPPLLIDSVYRTNGNCGPSSIDSIHYSNASGPVTFTLNPGAVTNNTGIFPGLTGTSYTVTITDALGCTDSKTITFTPTSTASFTATGSTTAASCPGINNGTITITVNPPGTYTYTLDGNASTTVTVTGASSTFNGVSGGAHSVTVADGGTPPCSVTVAVNVGPGTPVAGTSSVTATSCNNAANGTMTAVPSSGTAPYTYTINATPANTTGASTGTFTGLAAGGYAITFTDANGCQGTVNGTVAAGPALTASIANTGASCPGIDNGTVTVTAPTGTAPFSYTINATPANTTGAATGVFTGLPGGSYTVTFTDANGCTGTANTTVATGPAITGTSSVVNTSCNNATNGSMTATPTLGTAPYTYTINATPANTTGASTGTFTGLAAGGYIISFTDANGCQGTVTNTVAAGPALTASIANTGASCPGINNGTVTVTAPTGTVPFSYTINATPANTTGAATGAFTGLPGGSYTVTFTDANGCTGTAATTVATGTAITGTSSVVNTSCNNATNGSMTATPDAGSGTAPFTYTINATPANTTGATTGTFTGLAAGAYIITFTDANGCQGTVNNTVAAGPALTASIANTGASCPGINNGTVTVTAPTGTAPFSYTINATPANTTGAATGAFTGLPGGNYTVTFTDANGCTGTAATTVATGTAITGTSSVVNTSCNNATNGSMTATPAAGSGTAPFTYTINATPANITGAATGTFTGLASGAYIITFTDANGCQGTVNNTVAAGPALTATITNTGTACPGINNGTVTVTAPTGTAPFSYTINATPANTTGAATGAFTGLPGGNYTVTFTDANGCTGTAATTVVTGTAIAATSSFTATSCNTANDGTMSATPTAGSGTAPFTYTINATPSNTTGATTGTFTGLAAGTYIITFTDANGCQGTTSQTITAGSSLSATPNTTGTACPAINNGSFSATAPTGTAPFSYTINAIPANTTGAATGIFTGLAGGPYTITFTDANGCSGTVSGTVATGAAITATSSFVNTSCNNANNGSMTATPTAGSGTAPFTYTINATPANTTGATTGTFTGLTPGTYTVTYTDANGCSGTTSQTIAAGPALAATPSTTATACPAVNNGTITATPSTGTAPYSYTINATPANTTGAATGTFTGLAAGPYVITFTDANGCTGTVNGTISAGAAITATSSVVNTSCNNAADGSMTATPNAGSGTAPFSYTINATPANTTGAATGTFTGLTPGNYTITFTDANGCTGITSQTVVAGPALGATSSTTATACPSVNNGSMSATPTSGTAPYSYTINAIPANTTGAATGTFTGLAAGPYIISFTDANGCTGTVNGTVLPGAAITASSTFVNTSCNNANDGSMTATPDAGSGTAPFSYTINATPANTTGAATGTFTGLAPGNYTITFTDANGCTGTTSQTIAAGPALLAAPSTTATACPAINNGTITATPSTGTAPYSYTINATPANTTGATTGTFTGLAAGPYIITFTDANGCTGTVNGTISAGAALTAGSSFTNTSCNNAADGSVTATPTTGSGTAPFSYTINATPANTTGATTGTFTGLMPGTYTVTYTDANGCSGTISETVTAGPALTATPSVTATSCPGINNGTFSVASPTGTAPFSYTINATPANTTGATTGAFTGLAAGAYTISFTDANGCTGTAAGTVAQGAALTSTGTFSNPNCAGIDDGVFTATPTNGTAPYSYVIDAVPTNTTGAATGTFTGLAAGTYIITFTDANGCQGTQTQTLTTNAAITLTETHTDAKCFSSADGTITITPAGGVGPYTYAQLPSTSFQTGSTFSNLTAGTYTIRVKDNFGCTKDIPVTIAQPTLLTASAVKDNNTTCEGNDGGITVTGTGGTLPYSYSIDNGVTYATSGVFTNATNTAYNGTIKVKDANGCIATANNVTVGQDNNLTLDILVSADTTICQEASVAFAPTTNAGSSATYLWTSLTPAVPNSTISNVTDLNAVMTPADTAIYKLTVTYKACTVTDNVKVNVIWKPKVDAGPNVAICRLDSTLLSGTVSHISGVYDSLAWTPLDSLTTPSAIQTWAHPVHTTYYFLTVYTKQATYGCDFAVHDSVKVVIPADVVASAGRDTIAVLGMPHQLLGSGGSAYSWWSPTVTLTSPHDQNPYVTLNNDANFFVEVQNSIGCKDTAAVFVKVYNGPTYYVPNAFSPNGDGLNDIFRPIPVGIANTQYFKVMNRYGQTVFETNQYLKGWDGTFKGQKQPIGAYIWIIKGQNKDGKMVEMKGTVLLVQ